MNMTIRTPNAKEEKRKAVCLEQLSFDRQELLMRWPFIGGIIMRMELVPVRDDRLGTAATDGNSIFVDIDFYGSLSKDERLFVLAHEVWHSALLHFARRKNRDVRLFNMAADLEIHFALRGEKMREPWVLPHEESWATLPAEEIYERLLKKQRSQDRSSGSGGAGKNGTGAGVSPSPEKDGNDGKGKSESFDRHIYEGDRPDPAESEGTGGGEGGTVVIDDDYAPSVTSDTAERVRSRVISAAQQVERMQGHLPGAAAALLKKLLEPELPWQELLKQFVSSCYGGHRRWLPPSRRHVWNDLYLPSMRGEALKAVVALDTSGSTAGDMERFFTELVSLMKTFGRYELTVIQCDAQVQKVEKFSDAAPPASGHRWEVFGQGGTDFRPVFDYVKTFPERPEVLIYLTDGCGSAPVQPPPYPVLWVLTSGGTRPAAWGKSISFK